MAQILLKSTQPEFSTISLFLKLQMYLASQALRQNSDHSNLNKVFCITFHPDTNISAAQPNLIHHYCFQAFPFTLCIQWTCADLQWHGLAIALASLRFYTRCSIPAISEGFHKAKVQLAYKTTIQNERQSTSCKLLNQLYIYLYISLMKKMDKDFKNYNDQCRGSRKIIYAQ